MNCLALRVLRRSKRQVHEQVFARENQKCIGQIPDIEDAACCNKRAQSFGEAGESLADGVFCEFGDGVDVKFADEVCAVCFDGLHGSAELLADFLAREAFGDELQDFALAGSEGVEAGPAGLLGAAPAGVESIDEHMREIGGDIDLAAYDGVHGAHEFIGIAGLEEVAASAGIEDTCDIALIGVHGEGDDFDLRIGGVDFSGCFHAVEAGHGDIDEDDVGGKLRGHGDGIAAVLGLGDDCEAIGIIEQRSDASSHHGVVIDDEDGDGMGGGLGGARLDGGGAIHLDSLSEAC